MRTSKVVIIAIILFSLDSLLKINLESIRVHISHILLLLVFAAAALSSKLPAKDYFRKHKAIGALSIYLALHFILVDDKKSYFIVLSYFTIAIITHITIYSFRDRIDFSSIFKISIYTLIATGLTQYSLHIAFGYQLTLGGLDASYYNNGGSIAGRMRGMFLEPNWYGLYLSATLLGYFITTKRKDVSIALIAGSLICLFLSGNRLTLYYSLISSVLFIAGQRVQKRTIGLSMFASVVPVILFILLTFNPILTASVESDRSAAARSITAYKTYTYMIENFTPTKILIGNGLSTWGEVSYEESLSSRSDPERSKVARDTSESYVILFELGVLGAALFLLDIISAYRLSRASPQGAQIILLASLMLTSAFYYPIFFFMMYMAPYFATRSYCLANKKSSHANNFHQDNQPQLNIAKL
ncbi:hypothetical protein [Pseudomonas sp. BN102]|uniref:hypothetical protein n=1 Tax=Pseudomonas sp. BN102 TaxID=2567886 RepID=UPI002457FF38|nr:hypothetical protein [Pseudomonas sp. BN102]MDH4610267.1 hypothetical protein [Pseudomonas sp. BN102]